MKYQAQVLTLLHDGKGHQGFECTLALCQERFYWNTMFQDVTNYVKTCPHCQTVKVDYMDPKTKLGTIIANNPMDLLCIDLTKVDPLKSGKENILVLTDAFTKFIQVLVTPNQKALTVAKLLVDKWFYVYGIPAQIHSDQGWCFDNQIMKHLYALYSIEQSTTMPYNPRGNAQCERFNCTMMGLLTSLSKEQKDNWPLHLPSLVFVYNAMPHSTTGYHPYELMFGCKAFTICNAWLRLADYNDNYLQSKCEWVNQQHELILAANRHALKRIKQSVEKTVTQAGGKDLEIPIGNLVLLYDHLEGQNKIQDDYKSELFVVESKHQDPNVYNIKPLCAKGPVHTVNWQQLFDLQKSPGDNLLHPAPDTYLPLVLTKKSQNTKTAQLSHPYGTWSTTKVDSASLTSSYEDEESSGVNSNLFNCVATKLWR